MKVEVIGKPNDLAGSPGIQLLTFEEAIRTGLCAYRAERDRLLLEGCHGQRADGRHDQRLYPGARTRLFFAMSGPCRWTTRIVSWNGSGPWGQDRVVLWQCALEVAGYLDKLSGGVGLRRGRTHPTEIHAGDALDFWRVLLADKTGRRLLLFAEIEIAGRGLVGVSPGRTRCAPDSYPFRPRGVWGRLCLVRGHPFAPFRLPGDAATTGRPEVGREQEIEHGICRSSPGDRSFTGAYRPDQGQENTGRIQLEVSAGSRSG